MARRAEPGQTGRLVAWSLSAALVLAGCGHSGLLAPARDARIVAGRPKAAAAETLGIAIEADGQAWNGDPRDLERVMIPLRIAIENHGRRPLRIRYDSFVLIGGSSFETNPLPPFQLSRRAPFSGTLEPAFVHVGFFVVPDYERFYGTAVPVWRGPFDYAPGYNATYYQSWLNPLPTPEMRSKAIPEGVLESGGRLAGFLYFHKLGEKVSSVRFAAELADGMNQQSFGEITIPFVLK